MIKIQLLLFFLLNYHFCIRFKVTQQRKFCLIKTFITKDPISIDYKLENVSNSKVFLLFSLQNEKRVVLTSHSGKKHILKHVPNYAGDYHFCFNLYGGNLKENGLVELITNGDEMKEKDVTMSLDGGEEVLMLEKYVKEMRKRLSRAKLEATKLRLKTISIREKNYSANRLLKIFGIISLFLLCLLSFVQLYYLRRFFKKKKII